MSGDAMGDPVRDALRELVALRDMQREASILYGQGRLAEADLLWEEIGKRTDNAWDAARAALAGGVEQQPTSFPKGRGYTVEPHGKGWAIYRGRDATHHGLNLGYLTECEPQLPELIESALNDVRSRPPEDAAPARLEDGDIVERLRQARIVPGMLADLLHEAATQITALRAQVAARPSNAAAAHVAAEDDDLPGMLALAIGVREQRWPHTMDAKVWADKWAEHIEKNPEIPRDHGCMLGWFANAIMAGYDTACSRAPAAEPSAAHPEAPSSLTTGKDEQQGYEQETAP